MVYSFEAQCAVVLREVVRRLKMIDRQFVMDARAPFIVGFVVDNNIIIISAMTLYPGVVMISSSNIILDSSSLSTVVGQRVGCL